MRHRLLINNFGFHPRQVIRVVVYPRVVLQDDQGEVAAGRVHRHPRLHCPLHLANERIYLVVILLLHKLARVHEYGPEDRLQAALAHFAIHQDFHRISLHFQGEQPRRQKAYEV